MKPHSFAKHSVEVLESRIAPAAIVETGFKTATPGTPLLLTAGEGLSTGGVGAGIYLLYVEKGNALVFTTDFNLNNVIDFNEITGVAAGDGLRMISFVDIHGDIVTDLRPDTRLSDSAPLPDDPILGGDGLVLLNSTIERIEMRSLTVEDIGDQDNDQDVDDDDIAARLALSSYSIHGNILAGKGFGLANDPDSGLIINDAGRALQQATFVGPTGGTSTLDYFIDFKPTVGSIKTGTAAAGTFFSFGVSSGDNIAGRVATFIPGVGQAGGDIFNVRAADAASTFNIDGIEAGNGGIGARGGNIVNVTLNGDGAGGYKVLAGDGGRGVNGGAGGSIVNLSELGATTSQVFIETGDGGQGSTGTGGNGGNLSFGTVNLYAGVNIKLGNGGDGFVAGGNGASFTEGTFTTPAGGIPKGLNVVAQSVDRATGAVLASDVFGASSPVDFDENLQGDYVFTSADASEMGVVLNGGLAAPEVIYLATPPNAKSVVVADFNGDGHQDIAAASFDNNNFAGVYTFISKYEDLDGNGLSSSEDLNGNGVDDFLGFNDPIRSALPSLLSGDNVGPGVGANQRLTRAASGIGDLAAGDFDGDGLTDLAVVATYYSADRVAPVESQVVFFLKSDVEDDATGASKPTGQFFADFGVKGGVPSTPVVLPYDIAANVTGSVQLLASAPSLAAPNDILYLGKKGSKAGHFAYSYPVPAALGPTEIGEYDLLKVDTNRLMPTNVPNIDLEDASLRDFMLADLNNDGNVDYVALTEGPSPDYLVAIAGTATGAPGTYLSNAPASGGQNDGIALSKGNGTRLGLGSPHMAIRVTAGDADGLRNDIALLNFDPTPPPYTIETLIYAPRLAPTDNGATIDSTTIGFGARDEAVVAFDTFTPNIALQANVGYAVAFPTTAENSFQGVDVLVPPGVPLGLLSSTPYSNNGIRLTSGDGGDALVGRGGQGGNIGGGIKLITDPVTGVQAPQGALNITYPDNLSFDPTTTFQAGRGGNGFTTGGAGGDIAGLVLRRPNVLDGTGVELYAGDGGFGVSGAGGAGGDLRGNSIQAGGYMEAGDGGRGLIGGAGGNVIGNGLKNIYDARVSSIQIFAGLGGTGVKGGGAGGNITNFRPEFSFQLGVAESSVLPSYLAMFAGAGGNAVSGAGGKGGSITGSSPREGINDFAGEIYLEAGAGGSGTTGGAGGAVSNFQNRPSTQDNPFVASFLGGMGGAGITGNGGVGGAVTNIKSPSVGNNIALGFPPPLGTYSPVLYSRVLAGEGGNSAGANGGVGGAVSGLDVASTDGSLAIASGEGGAGLTAGGAGGNITNNITNVGGSSPSKLLVIAGAGGNASAFVPNPNGNPVEEAKRAFGGKIGVGGAGGSITGLTQELGISTRVDLIAGNGGSTINYGTIAPTEKTFVGKGGSVSNINARGSLGNSDPLVALQSYNNTGDANNDGLVDETVAEFVQNSLRNGLVPALNDAVGNVGIIVGTAGRLKTVLVSDGPGGPVFDSQPATLGVNGSLTTIKARNLASAVAGSIDRIASITQVSGLKIGFGDAVFTPGIIGADKGIVGVSEYFDEQGNIISAPVLDGALLDGAVIAKKFTDPGLVGRVFVLA